jgi:hypothetical protein
MRSALVLLALSCCLPVRSQPPAPRPPNPTQDNQGNATGKQYKTSDNHGDASSISSAIDKLTSEVTSWKQQQAGTLQKDEASADWWTEWSTLLSAVATVAVAVLAYRQWRTVRGHELALKAMEDSITAGRGFCHPYKRGLVGEICGSVRQPLVPNPVRLALTVERATSPIVTTDEVLTEHHTFCNRA